MIDTHATHRNHARAFVLAWLLLPASAHGQAVRIDSTVAVVPVGSIPQVEPHVAASPVDPDRIVAAAMTFPASADGAHIVAWYSDDGGATWRDSGLRFAGDDPWLAFAPDGTAYLSALGVVYRSDDGGRTWSQPLRVPGGGGSHDYSKMVAGDDGAVHVWTWWSRADSADVPALITSRDGGRTWIGPHAAVHSSIDSQVGSIDVMPDGALIAAFHELTNAGDVLESPRAWVVRSDDGGRTWSPPALVHQNFLADSPDLIATPQGHVLLSWMEIDADRTRWRMVVARSTDAGSTWGEPVILQQGALPDGAYPPHHPVLAVDGRGTIAVTWRQPAFDRGARCFGVAFSWSDDGGAAFRQPVTLAGPTCADAPGNRVPMRASAPDMTVLRRFGDGGDYHGLVALADGGFRVLWADTRTGVYRLWTTRIRVPASR